MQQIKHTMQSELGDTEYLATGKNLTEQPCVFFSVSLCLSLFLSSSLPPACFTNCIRFCRLWTAPQLVYVIKKTFMSSQYCNHFKGKYGIQCRSCNGDDLNVRWAVTSRITAIVFPSPLPHKKDTV